MYALRSVFLLAMDVVRGPYIHCYAPSSTEEEELQRVKEEAQLLRSKEKYEKHNQRELNASQEKISQLERHETSIQLEQREEVITATGNANPLNKRIKYKNNCSNEQEEELYTREPHSNWDKPANEHEDKAHYSPIYTRVSALCNLFVPRSEFCKRVLTYYEAESQLVFLYFAEEISGDQYARKTLRYSLCLVFELLARYVPVLTLCEEIQQSLTDNYGILLTNVMSELRTAEQKFSYISNALSIIESNKELYNELKKEVTLSNSKEVHKCGSKTSVNVTNITCHDTSNEHSNINVNIITNTNPTSNFIIDAKYEKAHPTANVASAREHERFKKAETHRTQTHKTLNHFVSPKSKEVRWHSLQELISELYSCLQAQHNNMRKSCKTEEINYEQNNINQANMQSHVRTNLLPCEKLHDEFSLVHLSNVHSFHMQHTTALQSCTFIGNEDVPIPLINKQVAFNGSRRKIVHWSSNSINNTNNISYSLNNNMISATDVIATAITATNSDVTEHLNDGSFDLFVKAVWQLVDGKRTYMDIVFALAFETDYTLAELANSVRRQVGKCCEAAAKCNNKWDNVPLQSSEPEEEEETEHEQIVIKSEEEEEDEEARHVNVQTAHRHENITLDDRTPVTPSTGKYTQAHQKVIVKEQENSETVFFDRWKEKEINVNQLRNVYSISHTDDFTKNILWLKEVTTEETVITDNKRKNVSCMSPIRLQQHTQEHGKHYKYNDNTELKERSEKLEEEELKKQNCTLIGQRSNEENINYYRCTHNNKHNLDSNRKEDIYFKAWHTTVCSMLEWNHYINMLNSNYIKRNNCPRKSIKANTSRVKRVITFCDNNISNECNDDDDDDDDHCDYNSSHHNNNKTEALTAVQMKLLIVNKVTSKKSEIKWNDENNVTDKSFTTEEENIILILPRVKWFSKSNSEHSRNLHYTFQKQELECEKEQKLDTIKNNVARERNINRWFKIREVCEMAVQLPVNWQTFSCLVYEALQHMQQHQLLKIVPCWNANTPFSFTVSFTKLRTSTKSSTLRQLALYLLEIMSSRQEEYKKELEQPPHHNRRTQETKQNVKETDKDAHANLKTDNKNINETISLMSKNAHSEEWAKLSTTLVRQLITKQVSEHNELSKYNERVATITRRPSLEFPSSSPIPLAVGISNSSLDYKIDSVITALFAAYSSFHKCSVNKVRFYMQTHPLLHNAFCNWSMQMCYTIVVIGLLNDWLAFAPENNWCN